MTESIFQGGGDYRAPKYLVPLGEPCETTKKCKRRCLNVLKLHLGC